MSTDTRRAVRRVRRTLDDAGVPLTNKSVLALCSGGIDSCVLVALLAQLPRGAAPRRVEVLWLDHGVQAPDAEAQAAADAIARSSGFEFLVRARIASSCESGFGGGVQSEARAWRYATAAGVARERGCDVVVTGHNANDQLECALLGIAGVTATSGAPSTMRVSRRLTERANVRLIRPLLSLSRARIASVASELGIAYADDPSNADPDAYVRNAIRHRVVPHLLDVAPGAGSALAHQAATAQERDDALRALCDARLDAAGGVSGDLDVRLLAPLPPAAQRALVARWLQRALPMMAPRVSLREVDARMVRAVASLASLPHRSACARVDLPCNACVRRDGYHLRITNDEHRGAAPT